MSRSERASPGGSTALSDRCTVRSTLVNVPVFSPQARRQHHVGQPGGLGQEHVLHDHEQSRLARIRRIRARSGSETAGLVPRSTAAGSSLLGVAEDLHGVGRRGPVRDHRRVDIPELGELVDVLRVVPVAEPGQVAVGAGLAGVLRGRLAVHLQNPQPGRPIMPRSRWRLLTWHAAAVAWFDW